MYPVIMAPREEIKDFVQSIVREFSPQRVLLFGSYARGNPTEDSDVDLLVVMPTQKRTMQQALEIRQRIPRKFPLDLLVKTPQDIASRVAMKDAFLTGILAEGETLYESPC
jgi:predicted nucleotidyltransferase